MVSFHVFSSKKTLFPLCSSFNLLVARFPCGSTSGLVPNRFLLARNPFLFESMAVVFRSGQHDLSRVWAEFYTQLCLFLPGSTGFLASFRVVSLTLSAVYHRFVEKKRSGRPVTPVTAPIATLTAPRITKPSPPMAAAYSTPPSPSLAIHPLFFCHLNHRVRFCFSFFFFIGNGLHVQSQSPPPIH